MDAVAAPFVQGKLTDEPISVRVDTTCAHCDWPISLSIDAEMHCEVLTEGAAPLVSVPLVNLKGLKDPSIIDAF